MYQKIIFTISILIMCIVASAQTPDHYPPPVPQPVEVNLFSIILYVVLPIGLVVAYYFYQRTQKKKKKSANNNKKDQSADN